MQKKLVEAKVKELPDEMDVLGIEIVIVAYLKLYKSQTSTSPI